MTSTPAVEAARPNDASWRAELRARLKVCRAVLGRAGLGVRKVPRYAVLVRGTGALAHPTPMTISELERLAADIDGSK